MKNWRWEAQWEVCVIIQVDDDENWLEDGKHGEEGKPCQLFIEIIRQVELTGVFKNWYTIF